MHGFRRLLFALPLLLVAPACGEKAGPDAKAPIGQATDDAIALLPANPMAVATVDGRAFFSSQAFGADLAKFTEKYLPLGAESGFQASRDVDRVTLGVYASSGVDVSAIVIGRFDEAKIKAVAANHTAVTGGYLVASQYLGRDVYTVNNVGFSLLAADRALVGTEGGIRRVLERIKDGRVKRDAPAWMIQTLETPSAAAAAAVDFATQPIPADLARQFPASTTTGLKAIRIVATFKDAGVQVALSSSYTDEAQANAAATTVKDAKKYLAFGSVIGLKITAFDVTTDKADMQIKTATDDQSLKNVLVQAQEYLGR